MTDRLYYIDSYCRTFDAVVTRAFEHDGRPAVTLSRTAFYPSSGGQPADRGTLASASILDVIDAGEVVHVISSPLSGSTRVAAEVDWARRFDHMQQHTGQHLLSAAFDRIFENPTVGFHLGPEIVTIDLAREATAADIDRAVDEANGVVWENRAVSIRFVSPAEAATLGLRKEPARTGTIRLIEIDGFDLCACGGTHVKSTGAVGLIAALGWERQRGGTRLTYVCGTRARRADREHRAAVAGSVRVLSVLPAELPSAVEKLHGEARQLRKRLDDLGAELAAFEGARLGAAAPEVAGVRVVMAVVEGSPAGLKRLAAAVVGAGPACAVLVCGAQPLAVVVGCAKGVPVDAAAVLRELIARFGGRGGGKPDLAQGGGLAAPADDVLSAARAIVENTLRGAAAE